MVEIGKTDAPTASLHEAAKSRTLGCTSLADTISTQRAHLPDESTDQAERILRLRDVMERVGLKHASIYQYMADGSFPQSVTLGSRAVGWLESEISEWIADRIHRRNKLHTNKCLPVPK